jgi:glycosyltransferase involved in cell wall biosynthesis
MKFSVIVPTYQEEGCIELCLHSIAQQDYSKGEFEIIVSDANSTDRTVEKARRYTVRIISDDRRGIAHGRNVGAQSAFGDVLVFVDADATLAPDFLSQFATTFADPNVVAATGIAQPADGKLLPRLVYYSTYILVRIFAFCGVYLFPGICVAYRQSAFHSVKGFREDFGIVEDLDLSRRISRVGRCRINKYARAFVSTRRLENHLFSTILFHIYSDMKYLFTGKASKYYPKVEEMKSWRDLWKHK